MLRTLTDDVKSVRSKVLIHEGAIVISDKAYTRLQWFCIGAGITSKLIGLTALGFLFMGCSGAVQIHIPPESDKPQTKKQSIIDEPVTVEPVIDEPIAPIMPGIFSDEIEPTGYYVGTLNTDIPRIGNIDNYRVKVSFLIGLITGSKEIKVLGHAAQPEFCSGYGSCTPPVFLWRM